MFAALSPGSGAALVTAALSVCAIVFGMQGRARARLIRGKGNKRSIWGSVTGVLAVLTVVGNMLPRAVDSFMVGFNS